LELTRIALERCATARDAIDTMGSLAEEYLLRGAYLTSPGPRQYGSQFCIHTVRSRNGFFGNSPEPSGAAESLAVADTEEAWLFHIMPDDSGSSAIWAAQRVPHGHATACGSSLFVAVFVCFACVLRVFLCVCLRVFFREFSSSQQCSLVVWTANMSTIRKMDLTDPENFRYSQSCLEVATRFDLWEPGTPFDFAAIYSYGEGLAKYRFRGNSLCSKLTLQMTTVFLGVYLWHETSSE